jgi:hypothetical protein
VAGGLAACGLTLLLLRGRDPRAVLAALAVGMVLWTQPAGRTLSPALDALMSPKPQADALKILAAKGYTPVSYDIYSGIYSYYWGGPLREIAGLDALDRAVAEGDVALVIKKKHWDAWPGRPDDMRPVFEQWLAGQPYYVAVRPIGAASGRHDLPDEK